MPIRRALAASLLAALFAGPIAAQDEAAQEDAAEEPGAEAPAEAARAAPPDLAPASEPFGLSGLLGLGLGMPLGEAVATLRVRGFDPDEEAARAAMQEAAATPSEGSPAEGLVIRRALVPTAGGSRSVTTEAMVFLRLDRGGVYVQVQLLAEPDLATDPYGAGRLLAVELYQDYADVAGPVGWLQIEARLRQAAGAAPSCERFDDRLAMVWLVEGDLAVPPLDDFAACWDRVEVAEAAAGAEAALARAVGDEGAPAAPDLAAFAIVISPDPSAGWVWMRRFDAGLRAEALSGIVADARGAQPAPVTAVEF